MTIDFMLEGYYRRGIPDENERLEGGCLLGT
jgi:hypothetical protein